MMLRLLQLLLPEKGVLPQEHYLLYGTTPFLQDDDGDAAGAHCFYIDTL